MICKEILLLFAFTENSNLKIITTEKDFLRLTNINSNKIKFIKSELKILDEKKFLKVIL